MSAISPAERHAVNAALRRWYGQHGEDAADLVALLQDMNAVAASTVRELRDRPPNLRA